MDFVNQHPGLTVLVIVIMLYLLANILAVWYETCKSVWAIKDYERGVEHGKWCIAHEAEGECIRVAAQIDCSKAFGDYNNFDKGVESIMIPYWQERGVYPLD